MTPTVRAILTAAFLLSATLAVHAATVAISQSGQVFSQRSADLAVGDTIVFTNNDDVRHNIRIVADGEEDLGTQQPGETLRYTFKKAGTFKIRCGIHPTMKMTVTVK